MMKLPFQKTYEDMSKFLSLSITSKDVKCLAFYFDNDTFKILGSGSQELPENSVRNGVVLDNDIVIDAIKYSVEKATINLEDKPKKVVVGVDGGTTIGLTTTVKMKRPNNDPIQPREIEELYSRITEASYIQAHNKVLQNTGDPDVDLDTITTLDIYLKISSLLLITPSTLYSILSIGYLSNISLISSLENDESKKASKFAFSLVLASNSKKSGI